MSRFFKTLCAEHQKLVQEIVEALVDGRYDAEPIVWKENHRSEDLKAVIDDYSEASRQKISSPPAEAYLMDTYINSFIHKGVEVALVSFPLWFGDEPSELVAEIELERNSDGQWVSSLADIRVP